MITSADNKPIEIINLMKKTFFYIILSIMAISMPSCNKDNDGGPDKIISKEQVVGTWETAQLLVNGSWVAAASNPSLSFTATFYDDGRYHGTGSIADGWGSYVIGGDEIKILYEGAVLMTYKVESIDDNKAQVRLSRGSETTTAVITKTGGSIITPN